MDLQDFIKKWTDKPVDFDGVYPNECYDLAHQFIYEVLGITDAKIIAHPSAYQIFTNFNENGIDAISFDLISNTPEGVPEARDIVVFGQEIGVDGHVCIFIDGTNKKFNSFDANWPVGSLPHIQSHNYTGVLGWLHPKNTESILVKKTDFENLVKKSSQYDDFLKNNYDKYPDVIKRVQELEGEIEGLNSQIRTLIDFQRQIAGILGIENQTPAIVGEITRLISIEDQKRDVEKELEISKSDNSLLKIDNTRLNEEVTTLKQAQVDFSQRFHGLETEKTANDTAWNACQIKLQNLIEQGVGKLVKTIKLGGFIIQIFKLK